MRLYQKPQLTISEIVNEKNLASLGEWLESSDGHAYKDAGITTYIIQS